VNLGTKRIIFGAILAFVSAFAISLANGLGALTSLGNALFFSLLISAIVAVLVWAMEIAQRKGYDPRVGFWTIIVLNLFGVVLLLWLPARNDAVA
jgi:drug/metabolite transporter (DMT)-like permease